MTTKIATISKYKEKLNSQSLRTRSLNLTNANKVYSRRITITECTFRYFDDEGHIIFDSLSPFDSLLTTISTDEKVFQNHIYMEIVCRMLLRILEDRTNILWAFRYSMKVTIGHCAIILKEAFKMEERMRMYEQMMRKTNLSFPTLILTKLIGFILKIFIPRLSRKLAQTIEKAIKIVNNGKIKSYLQSNPGDFLTYWDKKRTGDESTGKHFLALLSCDIVTAIFKKNISPLGLEPFLLSNISTIILNALANSLLDSILEVHCLFDESGVYRLFRIILHLQEYAMSIKNLLLSNQCIIPFKLLSCSMAWQRAELALAALNEQIFAGRRGDSGDKRGRSGGRRGKIGQLSPSPDELVSKKCENSSQRNCFMLGSCLMKAASGQSGQRCREESDKPDEEGGVPFSEEGKGVEDGVGVAPDKRRPSVATPALAPPSNVSGVGAGQSSPPNVPVPVNPSLLLMPVGRMGPLEDDERSSWASLAAQKSGRGGNGLAGMLRWNWNPRTWRREHSGTVFVELKIDVSDI